MVRVGGKSGDAGNLARIANHLLRWLERSAKAPSRLVAQNKSQDALPHLPVDFKLANDDALPTPTLEANYNGASVWARYRHARAFGVHSICPAAKNITCLAHPWCRNSTLHTQGNGVELLAATNSVVSGPPAIGDGSCSPAYPAQATASGPQPGPAKLPLSDPPARPKDHRRRELVRRT